MLITNHVNKFEVRQMAEREGLRWRSPARGPPAKEIHRRGISNATNRMVRRGREDAWWPARDLPEKGLHPHVDDYYTTNERKDRNRPRGRGEERWPRENLPAKGPHWRGIFRADEGEHFLPGEAFTRRIHEEGGTLGLPHPIGRDRRGRSLPLRENSQLKLLSRGGRRPDGRKGSACQEDGRQRRELLPTTGGFRSSHRHQEETLPVNGVGADPPAPGPEQTRGGGGGGGVSSSPLPPPLSLPVRPAGRRPKLCSTSRTERRTFPLTAPNLVNDRMRRSRGRT